MSEPRYTLKTYYVGAREPHVVTYSTAGDVVGAAADRRETGAGVALTVVRTIKADGAMRWCRSHRFDPVARDIADRHYNRQKIGSNQCARPGSCLVLVADNRRALWITSWQQHVQHAWGGAWENTTYRNEGAGPGIELIRQGVAATLAHYGEPPALGMITMIDRDKVKPTMVRGEPVWGWTYRKAGFVDAGETQNGKLVLQLWPADMPKPMAARVRLAPTPLFDFADVHPGLAPMYGSQATMRRA